MEHTEAREREKKTRLERRRSRTEGDEGRD